MEGICKAWKMEATTFGVLFSRYFGVDLVGTLKWEYTA